MAKFKITPTNIITGATAPYFVADFENEHDIEKFAKTLSNLFQFPRWEPSISKLISFKKHSKRW
jgi:hypothetical protein